MREIKFRAWDKSYNEMVFDITDVGRKRIIGESACETFREVLDSWEYEVMQYIGLDDANGVEIYEGDIMEGCGWESDQIFIVDFDKGEYFLAAPESADYEYYNGDYPHGDRVISWQRGKIIGNVYENPELLTK